MAVVQPASTGGRQSGFTLLELLVVLTVLALMYALAAPRLGAGLPGVSARGAARDLVAVLQEGRSLALTEQRQVVVSIDAEARSLQLDGRPQPLRGRAEIHAIDTETEPVAVLFYPDGSSSGIELRVEQENHLYRVSVDWLTGRVALQRGADDA